MEIVCGDDEIVLEAAILVETHHLSQRRESEDGPCTGPYMDPYTDESPRVEAP